MVGKKNLQWSILSRIESSSINKYISIILLTYTALT